MKTIDIQKLNDIEKAFWFCGLMYCESTKLISSIRQEVEKFNQASLDVSTVNNVDHCKHDQFLESIQISLWNNFFAINLKQPIRNVDIAIQIQEIFKKHKFVSQEDKNECDFSISPIIQSGGFYHLNLNSGSNEKCFMDDVIILGFGMKYNQYCANVIRTIVITPKRSKALVRNYNFLLQAQKFIMIRLRHGVKLGTVYEKTCEFVKKKRPDLFQLLTNNFGSLLEKEPKNNQYFIEAHSDQIAEKDMMFDINIGFQDIYDINIMERPPHLYSLWIGDCIKVNQGKGATLSTDFRIYKGKHAISVQNRVMNQNMNR